MARLLFCYKIKWLVVVNLVNEIKQYLKNPDTNRYNFETSAKKVKAFLQVFLLYILPVILLSVLTGIIRWKFSIEFKQVELSDGLFLVFNLLIIPVVEESAFRLPLVYNRISLSISSFFISYFFISVLIARNALDLSNYLLLRFAISIIISFVFLIIIKLRNQFFLNFWKKNNKVIFYIFLILFTIRHFDMYVLNWTMIFLLPIVVLPQLYGGILLSFTRIKYGFLHAVMLHVMVNFIAFLPKIIIYANTF